MTNVTKIKAGRYRLTLRGASAIVQHQSGRWFLTLGGPNGFTLASTTKLRDAIKAFETHVAGAAVLNATPEERGVRDAAVEYRALRAEYCKIRARLVASAGGDATPIQFDRLVASSVQGRAPSSFIAVAKQVSMTCARCAGTGQFIVGTENGIPKGPSGMCFRCAGKGTQNYADAKRNWGYDTSRKVATS